MAAAPLTRLALAIEEFRKLDAEMPMQTAAVFLLLAGEENLAQVAIAARANVSKSAISRIYGALSDRPGKLGLIHMEEDPNDLRYKISSLTPRGKMVLASLERILGD